MLVFGFLTTFVIHSSSSSWTTVPVVSLYSAVRQVHFPSFFTRQYNFAMYYGLYTQSINFVYIYRLYFTSILVKYRLETDAIDLCQKAIT